MYTVAVPAYNAADSVGGLLGVLCSDLPESVVEVVVCDNGSTDATAETVADWSRRCSRVRLVAEPRPGKPAAWNRLLAEARTDAILFFDADVAPDPDCLARMIEAFEASDHIAYCGRRRYRIRPGRSGSAWVAAVADPVIELCLVGACYGIRRGLLTERLRGAGFDGMPDAYAEDVLLLACLEPTQVQRVDDGVVVAALSTVEEFIVLRARQQLVRHELTVVYPALGDRLHRLFPEALQPWAQLRTVVAGPWPVARKLRWIAGGLAKSALIAARGRRIGGVARGLLTRYEEVGGAQLLRDLGDRRHLPADGGKDAA